MAPLRQSSVRSAVLLALSFSVAVPLASCRQVLGVEDRDAAVNAAGSPLFAGSSGFGGFVQGGALPGGGPIGGASSGGTNNGGAAGKGGASGGAGKAGAAGAQAGAGGGACVPSCNGDSMCGDADGCDGFCPGKCQPTAGETIVCDTGAAPPTCTSVDPGCGDTTIFPDGAAWPQHGRCATHAARSNSASAGFFKPRLPATFPNGAYATSAPISADIAGATPGTPNIFVGGSDGQPYGCTLNGDNFACKQLFNTPTTAVLADGAPILATPIIDRKGFLYAFRQDGTEITFGFLSSALQPCPPFAAGKTIVGSPTMVPSVAGGLKGVGTIVVAATSITPGSIGSEIRLYPSGEYAALDRCTDGTVGSVAIGEAAIGDPGSSSPAVWLRASVHGGKTATAPVIAIATTPSTGTPRLELLLPGRGVNDTIGFANELAQPELTTGTAFSSPLVVVPAQTSTDPAVVFVSSNTCDVWRVIVPYDDGDPVVADIVFSAESGAVCAHPTPPTLRSDGAIIAAVNEKNGPPEFVFLSGMGTPPVGKAVLLQSAPVVTALEILSASLGVPQADAGAAPTLGGDVLFYLLRRTTPDVGGSDYRLHAAIGRDLLWGKDVGKAETPSAPELYPAVTSSGIVIVTTPDGTLEAFGP